MLFSIGSREIQIFEPRAPPRMRSNMQIARHPALHRCAAGVRQNFPSLEKLELTI